MPTIQTGMPITPPPSSLPTKSPQSSSDAPTNATADESNDETPNRPDVSNIQQSQTPISSASSYHYDTVVCIMASSCSLLILLGLFIL